MVEGAARFLPLRSPSGRGEYEEYHPYGSTAWWAEKSGIQVSRKRYRYTGMERDEETGLQYHHHRYYLPWLGRWASADPAGLVDGVNRYQYGRGRVVGESDRSGLQSAPPDETLVQAGMRAKAGQFLGTGAAFAASAGDLVDFVQDPPVYTSAEHRVLAFGLSSVDASGMLQSVSNDMLALGTKVSPEGTEAGVAIGVFGPGVLSGLDLAGPAVKLVRELDELGEVVLDAAKQGLEEGAALVEAGLKHDLSAGKFLASKGGMRTFTNLFPEDVPAPLARSRLAQRDGKWIELRPDGTERSASGRYIFVQVDGELYGVRDTARVGGGTRPAGHTDLAQGSPVEYAGEIQFSGRHDRGIIRNWNNQSGHFQPDPGAASQANLPQELFQPYIHER